MSILAAPRQVTRTVRNIARIKQISTVFAKHGFQELMDKLGEELYSAQCVSRPPTTGQAGV